MSSVVSAKPVAKPAISVQLWSVRDRLKVDFEGTLTELSQMGFDGVEFASDFGPFKKDPQGLKLFLESLNLTASGVHVGFEQLAPEVIHQNLLFYKTLGTSYVIVPWDQRAWDPQGVKELVKQLNELSPQLKKYGMTLGFHNHDKEFGAFNGSTYWDYIAQQTSPDILLQLDVGWVNFAGKDAVEYVKKYPQRTLTTHYKVRTHEGDGLSPILGENQYPWDKLIKTNMEFGGTQWIVVEQEEYPKGLSSLESVKRSKRNLDRIMKKF